MLDLLSQSAVWGVALTIAAFGLGTFIQKKSGIAWLNPLLLASITLMILLQVLDIPYEKYQASASPLPYLLFPATVSLAIPLYEKWDLLKQNILAIGLGTLAGVLVSFSSILAIAKLTGLNFTQYVTILPKSVTVAIANDISAEFGGVIAITTAMVILTGLTGYIIGEPICRFFKLRHPVARGIGIGNAAHAMGTAKAMQIGETEGAMSGLAIALAGVLSAILAPLFVSLF